MFFIAFLIVSAFTLVLVCYMDFQAIMKAIFFFFQFDTLKVSSVLSLY